MAKGDHARFLRTFLSSPGSTGAIAPSSRVLARAMIAGLELGPDDLVLEFGPGTGPFTEALRGILAAPEQYLGIERNPDFVGLLEGRFPGLRFVEGSAEDAGHHLAAHRERTGRRGPLRAILSGLPFASLPAAVQDGILDALEPLLEDGAEFRTFQYVHAYGLPKAQRFRRDMQRRFGPARVVGPILRNLPPAFVLSWTGAASPAARR
ncbi:MAG: phospholipid methyltransferase [Planctomycetota bacterium]